MEKRNIFLPQLRRTSGSSRLPMRHRQQPRMMRSLAALVALCCATTAITAMAAEFNTNIPDLKIRWDNTLKYSAADRLKNPSPSLITPDPNTDDGDRNFDGGLISSRIDLFSEFDATFRQVGMRVSAAGWYDALYNRDNRNDSPLTVNSYTVAPTQFTEATRNLMGRKAEFLDAFVFGKFDLGASAAIVRLGRHSLLYGESLFFGSNGIAAAQVPIDIIKAIAVPNTPFKELARPISQLSGQIALTPVLTVGGYYQFQWEANRIPAAGSYFSFSDPVGDGAERILAAVVPGVGPVASFYRAADLSAPNRGQGGVQFRYRAEKIGTDFGLYGAQYHEKLPFVYVYPGRGVDATSPADMIGQYAIVYPQDIRVFGGSFSTTVGDANVAAEVSFRRNMPLANTGSAVLPGMIANGADDPLYGVGNTAHAQLSIITFLPGNPLWSTATLVGEIAWNRLLSVTRNPAAVTSTATRDASALRVTVEPSYFQVVHGLDITVPIAVGYGISGKSSMVQGFSVLHGGDVSIGLTGTYLNTWKFTANLTHYYGPVGSLNEPVPGPLSYKQTLADRDFVSLSVARTF